jgi:metal-sulfur cluster biosynthetic enzyme
MANKEAVLEALKTVIDPEVGLNIVDMGLIYDVHVEGERVDVTITLTSPGCPFGPEILNSVETVPLELEGIKEAQAHLVWSPPWDPETMMSEEGRDQLGIF